MVTFKLSKLELVKRTSYQSIQIIVMKLDYLMDDNSIFGHLLKPKLIN